MRKFFKDFFSSKNLSRFIFLVLLSFTGTSFAAQTDLSQNTQTPTATTDKNTKTKTPASDPYDLDESPVVKRATNEDQVLHNSFGIAFYKPTLFMRVKHRKMNR
jgi:hypothetical protein